MKKRNRSAKFLTCLLPCSLLISTLPLHAQETDLPEAPITENDPAVQGELDAGVLDQPAVQADEQTGTLAAAITSSYPQREFRYGEGCEYPTAASALSAAVSAALASSNCTVTVFETIDLGSETLSIEKPSNLTIKGISGDIQIVSSCPEGAVLAFSGSGRAVLENLTVRNRAGSVQSAAAVSVTRSTLAVRGAALQMDGAAGAAAIAAQAGTIDSSHSVYIGSSSALSIEQSSFYSTGDQIETQSGTALAYRSGASGSLSGSTIEAGAGCALLVSGSRISYIAGNTMTGLQGICAQENSNLTLNGNTITAAQSALLAEGYCEIRDTNGLFQSDAAAMDLKACTVYLNGTRIAAQTGLRQTYSSYAELNSATVEAAVCAVDTTGGRTIVKGTTALSGGTHAIHARLGAKIQIEGGTLRGAAIPYLADANSTGQLAGGVFQVDQTDQTSIQATHCPLGSLLASGYSYYQNAYAQDLEVDEQLALNGDLSQYAGTVFVAQSIDLSSALRNTTKYIGQESSLTIQTSPALSGDSIWLLKNLETGQIERRTSDTAILDISDLNTAGRYQVSAAIRRGDSYLRTNSAFLYVQTQIINSITPLTDQVGQPVAAQALKQTLEEVPGFENPVLSWGCEETTADFNTVYTATITASIQEGVPFELEGDLPEGWSFSKEGSRITLQRIFEATRKERLTIARLPQDLNLPTFYDQFSDLLRISAYEICLPKTALIEREKSEALPAIQFSYTCADFDDTPEHEMEVFWRWTVRSI